MDLDAKHELDEMCFAIAVDDGTPKQRAQHGAKGLLFLEARHVPSQLRNELNSLRESYTGLGSMSKEDVRQFITRVFSLRNKLYFHDKKSSPLPKPAIVKPTC
jgi:hypothetical protein